MAEIQRRNKKTGQIGVFDSDTKQFLRWADEPPAPTSASSEEPGMLGSAAIHGLQGLTFGLSDEMIGGLEAIPKMFTDKRLENEGLLDKFSRLYKQQRDLERANLERAAETNPVSSFTGELAGGFALPGKWLAEGGLAATKLLPKVAELGPNAAKLAEVAASPLGKMITGGAEAGALYEGGKSTKEDLGGILSDMKGGAEMGALLTGGLGTAGMGIAKLAPVLSQYAPKSEGILKRAYQKGREGMNILSPEFEQQITQGARKEAEQLTGLIGGEQKALQEGIEASQKEAFNILEKARKEVDDGLTAMQNDISQHLKNQKATAETQYQALNEKAQKDLHHSGKKLRQNLEKVDNNIRKEYDVLDKAATEVGAKIDSRPIISDLMVGLEQRGVDEKTIERLTKTFQSEFGDISVEQFRILKQKLRDVQQQFSDRGDIRGFIKQLYGKSLDAFEEGLTNMGHSDLANQYKQTNSRFKLLNEFDDLIGGIKPQALKEELAAGKKAGQIIENIAQPQGEALRQEMLPKLKELAPKEAPDMIKDIESFSQKMKQIEENKPQIPTLNETLQASPEFQQQQKLLEEFKGIKAKDLKPLDPESQKAIDLVKQQLGEETAAKFEQAIKGMEIPERKSFLKQFGTTPEATKKKVLGLIPEAGERFGNLKTQQELDDLLKLAEEKFGPEKAKQIRSNMENIASDLELGRAAKGPEFGGESLTRAGAAKTVAGGGFTSIGARVANFGGLSVKSLMEMTPVQLAQRAAQTSDKVLGDILKQFGTRDKAGRQALLFSLMQQPAYRQYVESEEDKK